MTSRHGTSRHGTDRGTTIRDVASRAGVSPATVSRVFTRPDAVTLPTRQRVLAAAEELRYTPHPVARSLARGRTGNIGLVVPDIAVAFSAVVVKAVAQRARQDDHALFVADSDDRAADEVRLARAMAPQVDGLLLLSPLMADDDLRDLAAAVPLVAVNRQLAGVPAVLMTSDTAAAHAVEHLHALGHRKLAYLAGPDNWSNAARQAAFTRSCARLGVPGEVLGPFDPTFSAGIRAADLVLAGPTTGVLAYNDDVAVGVLSRLADRGVAVPGSVSVVGFDDTALASMVTPRLSTVRLPIGAAGVVAVTLLADVLRGDDVAARGPVELPAELVVRASSGPAPDPR
jgi:LacI family transcriptional regulator/LacI family repressor for deo operon, udp, cdd, tsx, nupC, and nupG